MGFLPYGTSKMAALRRLRRSCSFEFPAETAVASDEFRDSVSVLFAVALAETEAEETDLLEELSPPLPLILELPCPESDESWLGLISLSVK